MNNKDTIEFQQQLINNDKSIKIDLLENEQYLYLKEFYGKHFQEISDILERENSRTAIEAIQELSHSTFTYDSDEFLFMKGINDAICHRIITEEDFE